MHNNDICCLINSLQKIQGDPSTFMRDRSRTDGVTARQTKETKVLTTFI